MFFKQPTWTRFSQNFKVCESCSVLQEQNPIQPSGSPQCSPFMSDVHLTHDGSFECPFPNQPVSDAPATFNLDRAMLVHDVPGDGNCLFHSIHLSCLGKGNSIPNGPQLRNAVCEYLKHEDSDWIVPFLVSNEGTDTDPVPTVISK